MFPAKPLYLKARFRFLHETLRIKICGTNNDPDQSLTGFWVSRYQSRESLCGAWSHWDHQSFKFDTLRVSSYVRRCFELESKRSSVHSAHKVRTSHRWSDIRRNLSKPIVLGTIESLRETVSWTNFVILDSRSRAGHEWWRKTVLLKISLSTRQFSRGLVTNQIPSVAPEAIGDSELSLGSIASGTSPKLSVLRPYISIFKQSYESGGSIAIVNSYFLRFSLSILFVALLRVGPDHNTGSAIYNVNLVGRLQPWPNFQREVGATFLSPNLPWSSITLDVVPLTWL